MRPVPVLAIEPSAGALRCRLDLPERDLVEPLVEEVRQPLDADTLAMLQQSADALLRSAESPGFADEARARGGVLYRTLVPARLRARLKALRGPLLVSTPLVGVPWEVLHDEEEFWGLRYALGKRLVLDRPLPAVAGVVIRDRPRALVIGSDPRGDLPFVRHEVEAICDALERWADIECVTDQLATFDAVTAFLGGGFDLIHYCGHVVRGSADGPALLLAEQKRLSVTTIEANLRGRPLVFLNGCASARGHDEQPGDGWEASFANVAYGFLFGGATGAVATLSDVGDRHAATLAEGFYRRALAGEPVGEALRAARAECRANPATQGSPTWLSFVLYGNPAQVLLPERGQPARLDPPAASPAEQANRAPRKRRRLLARPAAASTLLLLAVAVVVAMVQLRGSRPRGPVVVGVMEVRARTTAVPRWMQEITRDGLNTILSKFPPIRVYSRQKIDFVREKRGLREIEAAEALGMSKMISATVGVVGEQVMLDLEVVDIASGLVEGFARVQGAQERFMELQADLAVRALGVLGVVPTGAEVEGIRADRSPETLHAYRLLADTLGEPVAERGRPAPPPPAPATPAAPGTSWLCWPGPAYAQEPAPDEVAIHALLARYGTALEAKRIAELAQLQVEMSERQRSSLERYFGTAGDLKVRIHDVDVLVEGDDAIATFTREDVFVDAGSGRRMRLEVRISGTLAKEQGTWKIVALRDPL